MIPDDWYKFILQTAANLLTYAVFIKGYCKQDNRRKWDKESWEHKS